MGHDRRFLVLMQALRRLFAPDCVQADRADRQVLRILGRWVKLQQLPAGMDKEDLVNEALIATCRRNPAEWAFLTPDEAEQRMRHMLRQTALEWRPDYQLYAALRPLLPDLATVTAQAADLLLNDLPPILSEHGRLSREKVTLAAACLVSHQPELGRDRKPLLWALVKYYRPLEAQTLPETMSTELGSVAENDDLENTADPSRDIGSIEAERDASLLMRRLRREVSDNDFLALCLSAAEVSREESGELLQSSGPTVHRGVARARKALKKLVQPHGDHGPAEYSEQAVRMLLDRLAAIGAARIPVPIA